MEVVAVTGYGALSDVYEWLISDDRLTPAKAAAVYYSEVVGSLPPNARVLDCACGTGQLAVGLARPPRGPDRFAAFVHASSSSGPS